MNGEKKNRSYAYLIPCLFSFAIVILFMGNGCSEGDDAPSISKKGTVLLGTTGPKATLDINGSLGDAALFIDPKGNVGIGTDKPETTLDVHGDMEVAGTLRANALEGYGAIPKGVIVIWSGNIKDIPKGWALCDGTQNTPDLTNKFVLGCDKGKNHPHLKGGMEKVKLSISEMPSHTHQVQKATNANLFITQANSWKGGGSNTGGYVGLNSDFSINEAGEGKEHENMPPYYVLAYIMKLDDKTMLLIDKLVYKKIRLENYKRKNYYLRKDDKFKVQIDIDDKSSSFKSDSTFIVVPGISGSGISFRSEKSPNHYIRHQESICKISKYNENDILFLKDASWTPRQGLANHQDYSFESVNFPGDFMQSRCFNEEFSWDDKLVGKSGKFERKDIRKDMPLREENATWVVHFVN